MNEPIRSCSITSEESLTSKAEFCRLEAFRKLFIACMMMVTAGAYFGWLSHRQAVANIRLNTSAMKEVVQAARDKAEFDKVAVQKLGVQAKIPPVVLQKQEEAIKHLDNAARDLKEAK